jgi:hypothetical protein
VSSKAYDWSNDYPCVVVHDRYGGTYSGGAWLAYPKYLEDVPPEADGGDIECDDFWHEHAASPAYPVGLGADPAAALDDLRAKARGERDWCAGNPRWRDKAKAPGSPID